MIDLDHRWDAGKRRDEAGLLAELVARAALDEAARARIVNRAARLVTRIRSAARPGMMDVFLAEYGLSTDEGDVLIDLRGERNLGWLTGLRVHFPQLALGPDHDRAAVRGPVKIGVGAEDRPGFLLVVREALP